MGQALVIVYGAHALSNSFPLEGLSLFEQTLDGGNSGNIVPHFLVYVAVHHKYLDSFSI